VRGERRWKLVAVLAAGMAVGVAMAGPPAAAHVGGTVTHLWNHLKPKADARYVNESAIKTIQGNWAAGGWANSTSSDAWDNISFGFELAAAPQEHFIPAGSVPPARCPGTAASPKAAAGHLCVYESQHLNRAAVTIFTGATGGVSQASRWGAGLWLQPAAAGDYFSYGTWAVTAPAGPTPARPSSGGGEIAGE
jgi:hypothetical protein